MHGLYIHFRTFCFMLILNHFVLSFYFPLPNFARKFYLRLIKQILPHALESLSVSVYVQSFFITNDYFINFLLILFCLPHVLIHFLLATIFWTSALIQSFQLIYSISFNT